jgi:colanic acid/amylovoran biosynthesis glycosyltransferase
VKLAYFVNDQPKPSHTFIRREIMALERLGQPVVRYALRGWADTLVDPDDVREQAKTQYVLKAGLGALLVSTVRFALANPGRALRGLARMWETAQGRARSLAHHVVTWAEACEIVQWCKRDGIDHVHAHFGTNSAEVVMLARAMGGPTYSFTVHGADEWDMPRQLRLREKLQHAAFVVAISSFTRSQMARWARPEDRDKIHVVHCGLDAAAFAATPTPVPDNHQLVCVGRLCVEKGQDTLVQAIAKLVERRVPVALDLVGDGPLRERIEGLVKELRLEKHVSLSGWASSAVVFDKFRAARAMVLPSTSEGLPVVIMEALALGRPVVTTYIAGIPELIRDGQEGFLIPAGDVRTLVAALERVLVTPTAELGAMALKGHHRVKERHLIDTEAAKLLTLFGRTMKEGGSARTRFLDIASD